MIAGYDWPLALAIRDKEEQIRAGIGAEFTQHAYFLLAPDNPHLWDGDGFYTARDAMELMHYGYPLPGGELEFTVPADCPYWSAPCVDGAHIVRGFLRHAWLAMPEGGSTGVVAVPVHSTAPRILVRVDNCLLEQLSTPQRKPGTLLWRLGNADPHGLLHLHCDDPIAFSPKLGRISCRVGKPYWYR